jgi:outer membrane lipoprotein-sorting protein
MGPLKAMAQQPAKEEIKPQNLTEGDLRTIQKTLHQAPSVEMDFEMTRVTGLRGSKTRRQGKAFLMKPNKFNWMFETPVKEYKLFDGMSFYDYDPTSQSATKLTTTGEMTEQIRQIVAVVLDFDALLKTYDLVSAQRVGQTVTARLKPKSKKAYTEIGLTIDEKSSSVVGFSMAMEGKSRLDYVFRNAKRGHLKDSDFILPAQVKINKAI